MEKFTSVHTNPNKYTSTELDNATFWANLLSRIPSLLYATSDSDTQITLNWTNGIGIEYDGFHVYRSTDGVNYSIFDTIDGMVSSHVLTVPSAISPNYFYIKALKGGYESASSNITRTGIIEISIIQPASPVSSYFYYIASSGALYADWGDGHIDTLTCNGVYNLCLHNYSTGGTTYTLKIRGDLGKLVRFVSTIDHAVINTTEFIKAENISILSFITPYEIYGSLDGSTTLTEIWIANPVIVSSRGGIELAMSSVPDLEIFECNALPGNRYVCNVSGSFSQIPKLKQWCALTKVGGSIDAIKDIEYFSWGYALGTDPATATIQSDENAVRIWGDISDKTHIWFYGVNGGAATVTGSTTLLSEFESLNVSAGLTKPSTVAHMPKLCNFQSQYWELSETEINQYMADFWANREVVRTYMKNTIGTTYGAGYRAIYLNQNPLNAHPSGQGLIDFVHLLNSVNPNPPANGVKWLVAPRLTYGAEMMNNPMFASQGNWLLYGDSTISGGKLRFTTGVAGFAYQAPAGFVAGHNYLIEVTCDSWTQGIATIYMDSDLSLYHCSKAESVFILYSYNGFGGTLFIQNYSSLIATFSLASIKEIS